MSAGDVVSYFQNGELCLGKCLAFVSGGSRMSCGKGFVFLVHVYLQVGDAWSITEQVQLVLADLVVGSVAYVPVAQGSGIKPLLPKFF